MKKQSPILECIFVCLNATEKDVEDDTGEPIILWDFNTYNEYKQKIKQIKQIWKKLLVFS